MDPVDDSNERQPPLIDLSPALGAPSSSVVPADVPDVPDVPEVPDVPDVGDVVGRAEHAPSRDAAATAVIAPPD